MTRSGETPSNAANGPVPLGQRWAEWTAPDFRMKSKDEWVVLVPVGATEQHGRHLPVDVDTHLAHAVCAQTARRDPLVLVAPTVSWGVSGGHIPFGGAISLQPETLLHLLRDICQSILASGFRCLLLVNGHNGNIYVAGQVAAELGTREGVFAGALNYFDLIAADFQASRRSKTGGEGHAGELETSLELFLRPEHVGDRRDARYIQPASHAGFADLAERGAIIQGFDLERAFPEGVMGDPTSASAELGAQLFTTAIDELVAIVNELREHVRQLNPIQST